MQACEQKDSMLVLAGPTCWHFMWWAGQILAFGLVVVSLQQPEHISLHHEKYGSCKVLFTGIDLHLMKLTPTSLQCLQNALKSTMV